MAYITVTTTDTAFRIDFGAYSNMALSSGIIPYKRSFRKSNVVFSLFDDRVEAQTINNNLTFPITVDGAIGTFKVDSINGIPPTDNSNLYDMLEALL